MSCSFIRIGDLFPRVLIGGTPQRGNASFFGGPHVWVSIRDMDGKAVIRDSAEHLSDEGVLNSNCKLVRAGSLLFSFKLTVGRVAKAGVDLYTNEAIAAFSEEDASASGIDLEYLALVLPAIARSDGTKNSMGAPLLNKDKIANLRIPCPNINDQRRIAGHLSGQLGAVEEARQAAQAQLNDVQRLAPAILEAVFAETADAEFVRIGDVARTTSGTTPSRSRKDFWEPAKYPWVKTGEVAFEPISSTEERISETALAECSLSLLPPGTVLIAMYGQGKTRGQSAVLEVEAATNQACFAILPNETFDPGYLQFWLRHSYQNLRAQSEARGGNQSNLNGEMLNGFEVPLVPRARQEGIARKIRAGLAEADRVRSAIEARLQEIELLPSRLLANVFEAT